MPRTRGYGRRPVEQTRSVDIRDLRKAAYAGEAEGNWLDACNKLFCAGVQPKHWNDAAITLDGQMLPVTWVGWHFGRRRPFSCAYAAEGCCSYLLHAATPGDVGIVTNTYATRQAGQRYRLILKAQKVRERLGGDLGVANPFPAKPKGMHSRRYDRLRARHDQALQQSLMLLKI